MGRAAQGTRQQHGNRQQHGHARVHMVRAAAKTRRSGGREAGMPFLHAGAAIPTCASMTTLCSCSRWIMRSHTVVLPAARRRDASSAAARGQCGGCSQRLHLLANHSANRSERQAITAQAASPDAVPPATPMRKGSLRWRRPLRRPAGLSITPGECCSSVSPCTIRSKSGAVMAAAPGTAGGGWRRWRRRQLRRRRWRGPEGAAGQGRCGFGIRQHVSTCGDHARPLSALRHQPAIAAALCRCLPSWCSLSVALQ